MDDIDDLLNNIDLDDLTPEDLENLGFDEDLNDISLSDEELENIRNEILNNETANSLFHNEISREDIINDIYKIQNEQPLYSDLYYLENKEQSKQNVLENVSEKSFIHTRDKYSYMKKAIDVRKRWWKWDKRKLYYRPNERAIEGISITSLRKKKDFLSLYNIKESNYTRPFITFDKCKEIDIPSDSDIIFCHNSLTHIKYIKNTVKLDDDSQDKYFYIFDQKFSLEEEKKKALKKHINKIALLAKKINNAKIYKNIINKWDVNPLYPPDITPPRETYDVSKFIDKNFSENAIKFRKKINFNKPFLTIKMYYRIKRYFDSNENRHKKYEVKKTNVLYNKKYLSKDDIINSLNLYKNCHKAAENLQVSYNTFKKYARMYNIDTSQYWKKYIENCKNKIIEPNVKQKPKQKRFKRLYFKKIDIIKPHDVRGINDSINKNYIQKRKLFSKPANNIINQSINIILPYNGPYITDINNLNTSILYKVKTELVNNELKENKCEICGCLESNDNPLLINFIDDNIKTLSFDNIKIICYNCFILNNYLINKSNIITPDNYYSRKLYNNT